MNGNLAMKFVKVIGYAYNQKGAITNITLIGMFECVKRFVERAANW